MQTASKEEFEKKMMRIRFVLENAWIDAFSLEAIDKTVNSVKEGQAVDKHLVPILNHYRKLMQYDLCLSVTKLFEKTGKNSLTNIQADARKHQTGDWGKFPKVMSSAAYQKAEAYRNRYLAHLDVEVSADPLTNGEMEQLLKPATDFFNNVCINVDEPEWQLTERELQSLHIRRDIDLLFTLALHIEDAEG